MIPKGSSHLFWQSVHAGANKCARENNADVIWNGPATEVDYTSQLQIIDSLADISTSTKTKKLQYAALIREEQLMLVWHDDLDRIMTHAARLEDKLLALVSNHTRLSPVTMKS